MSAATALRVAEDTAVARQPGSGGELAAPRLEETCSKLRQVCVVLGATLGLATGFSGLYFSTLPLFLLPIGQTLGLSRAAVSAVSVMSMLGLAVGAPISGLLIDRFETRHVILGSMLMFVACLLTLSILPPHWVLFALVSCMSGLLGIATGPAGYLSLVPCWFNQRLGLALSVAMGGIGAGAMLLPGITQAMITQAGWRHTYQMLAMLSLASGLGAYALVGPQPSRQPGRSDASALPARRSQVGESFSSSMRSRSFWTILLVLLLGTASTLGTLVHLPAMLSGRHLSSGAIALVASAVGLGVMTGRLASGALMDAVHAPLVCACVLLLGAVGIGGIGFGPTRSSGVLVISAVLLGLAIGAEGDFAAFVVRRYFGMRSFGTIYGVMFATYAVGGLAGPVTFGIMFDHFGNYRIVSALATLACAAISAIVLTLGRYRYAA